MADGTCLEQCHTNSHCHNGQICFSDGSCKNSCNSIDECPTGQYCHLDHKGIDIATVKSKFKPIFK